MNWGYKITIVIVVFIISMVSMVFVAMQQTNDMMDKNYYDKEVKYQSLIDASDNLRAVTRENILVESGGGYQLNIPKPLLQGFGQGEAEFLSNIDKNRDVQFSFQPDTAGVYALPQGKLTQGSYKIRVRWNSDGKAYYKEQDLTIF